MFATYYKIVVPAVLLYLATPLCYVSCKALSSTDSFLPQVRIPRTLYGTPQEMFLQLMAYKTLKIAVKMQKIECYKRFFCQVSHALGMSSFKASFANKFMSPQFFPTAHAHFPERESLETALDLGGFLSGFIGRPGPYQNGRSGIAELPDSFLGAIGKGWIGQNCTQAYRSCDRARDFVRRIVDAVLNTKPSVE